MVLSLDLKKQNQKKNQNCVFYCEHQYKKINAFIISQPVGEADSLFFLMGLELMWIQAMEGIKVGPCWSCHWASVQVWGKSEAQSTM